MCMLCIYFADKHSLIEMNPHALASVWPLENDWGLTIEAICILRRLALAAVPLCALSKPCKPTASIGYLQGDFARDLK